MTANVYDEFESIGLNCEFGLFQRAQGSDLLGLLRWSSCYPESLEKALTNRFESIGDPSNIEIRVLHDVVYYYDEKTYGFSGHCHVGVNDVTIDRMHQMMVGRIGYMKRRFLEQLETGAKIYVYKQNFTAVADPALHKIADAIAGYGGGGVLLWVTDSAYSGHEPGSIVEVTPNFFHGHITKLAPYDDATQFDEEGWQSLCLRAHRLIRDSQGRASPTSQQCVTMPSVTA